MGGSCFSALILTVYITYSRPSPPGLLAVPSPIHILPGLSTNFSYRYEKYISMQDLYNIWPADMSYSTCTKKRKMAAAILRKHARSVAGVDWLRGNCAYPAAQSWQLYTGADLAPQAAVGACTSTRPLQASICHPSYGSRSDLNTVGTLFLRSVSRDFSPPVLGRHRLSSLRNSPGNVFSKIAYDWIQNTSREQKLWNLNSSCFRAL
jgi:hypothetical protein